MTRPSRATINQRKIDILKVMEDGIIYTAKQLSNISKVPFKYVKTLLIGMKSIGLIEEVGLEPRPKRKSSFRKLWRKKNKVFWSPWVRLRL